MIEIVNVHDYSGGLEKAAAYFHQAWSGISKTFYLDAIVHSSRPDQPLPQFFLLLRSGKPIGCYGLVTKVRLETHGRWLRARWNPCKNLCQIHRAVTGWHL